MARDPYIERRMLNWVRWKAGAGDMGLGFGSASVWSRVVVDVSPSRDSVIPTNAIEAEETDRAVQSLPGHLRATVMVCYLSDDPMPVKAARLACAESTVHARVADAHKRISIWFSDRTRHAAERRHSVESAQHAARVARMGPALSIDVRVPPVARKIRRK